MKRLLFAALCLACSLCAAQQPRQDAASVQAVAELFLTQQTAGLPGKVTVSVGKLDPRMSLAPCGAPEAFLAPGARAWGRTTVGVRCLAPVPWTIYLQAQVSVLGSYVATAAPLAQGQAIDGTQLTVLQGDLAALPAGVATDMAQVVGKSPIVSLPPGMPVRLDSVKSKPVIQQGQLVRVVSSGAGFRVSAEARAIGTAAEGQVVQVRTAGGSIISGIAKAGGTVDVAI